MANETEKLLDDFLEKFSLDKIKNLKLEDYTGTGDTRDDFTYWVEWKLDKLGGIQGGSSFKFGVYKYKEKPKTGNRQGYRSNDTYAWVEKYGETHETAFSEIKERIHKVVEAASNTNGVDYEAIQQVELGDAFKWKVAFLYSKKRLVTVYQAEALETAARRLGVLGEHKEKSTMAELQKALVEYYENNKDEYNNDIFVFGGKVWDLGNTELSQSKQIIKYGAPGTGKTYSVEKDAKKFFEIWQLDARRSDLNFRDHYEFVQFHPSYSYEDFIEGIKPVIDGGGQTKLELRNGIFKSFCKKAAKYEIWLLKNGLLNNKKLDEILVSEVKETQNKEGYPFAFPTTVEDGDSVIKYIPPYFFVIDEINRADLSRVFGELMYCLEYRGYEGKIKTQYSELETKDTIFYADADSNSNSNESNHHYFFIPNNVYIIGTMNTIDRSIESFDFALRRRFLWQRIEPSETVLRNYFEEEHNKKDFGDYIIPLWNKLNMSIGQNPLLGPDYQIGHSYLMKLDKYRYCTTASSYRDIIWQNHILPILEEYFRGMGGEAKTQIDKLQKLFCSTR